jgi:hypothetical protein
VFARPVTISLTGSLPAIAGDATLAGRPGVAIVGTPAAGNFCLRADEGRVNILWLEISGCVDDGIELHGTAHWIAHVKSYDHGDDGIDVSGPSNRVGPDVGIWNNGDAGLEIEGTLNLIEQSRTANNSVGVRFLAAVPGSQSMLVRNTIVYNGTGIVVPAVVDDLALWQNTIYGNQGDGIRFDAPAANAVAGAAHDVRNNVFSANTGWAITTSGGFEALSSNAYYQNGLGTCNGCDSDPLGIAADPELMDPTGGDFRLGPVSPCIDAGEDLGLGFEGAAPDLGAFEHEQ